MTAPLTAASPRGMTPPSSPLTCASPPGRRARHPNRPIEQSSEQRFVLATLVRGAGEELSASLAATRDLEIAIEYRRGRGRHPATLDEHIVCRPQQRHELRVGFEAPNAADAAYLRHDLSITIGRCAAQPLVVVLDAEPTFAPASRNAQIMHCSHAQIIPSVEQLVQSIRADSQSGARL